MRVMRTPAHEQPYGAIRMACPVCDRRFSHTVQKDEVEVACPKCGEQARIDADWYEVGK